MTETLRERVRERLAELIKANVALVGNGELSTLDAVSFEGVEDAADAILREFRLQPVAVGKVTGEGEVEGL